MNKLLTITLVLSAIATMVPAHAVETRRQERARLAAARQQNNNRVQPIDDASDESALSESESDDESSEMIQNEVIPPVSLLSNRKALVAVAALGTTAATAAYLYATAEDCGNVAHAYCTGQVGAQALETCRVYWPMIPVVGSIACWFQ